MVTRIDSLSQAPSAFKSQPRFGTDDGCSIEQACAKAISLLARIKLFGLLTTLTEVPANGYDLAFVKSTHFDTIWSVTVTSFPVDSWLIKRR